MTVSQVLSDAGCQRVRDHFIPRMTEHDVLVTGIIKIMDRLLAVAARLLALVESLALRHRDVHTVRRVIRLVPSEVWSPHLLRSSMPMIRYLFWSESSGDACSSPSCWCHCLPAGSLLRGHHLCGLTLVAESVAIIAQRLLGIDGCPHRLCLVAHTCALPLGYALFILF